MSLWLLSVCRSYCYMFAYYYHFMLCLFILMSDKSPCGYWYDRTRRHIDFILSLSYLYPDWLNRCSLTLHVFSGDTSRNNFLVWPQVLVSCLSTTCTPMYQHSAHCFCFPGDAAPVQVEAGAAHSAILTNDGKVSPEYMENHIAPIQLTHLVLVSKT